VTKYITSKMEIIHSLDVIDRIGDLHEAMADIKAGKLDGAIEGHITVELLYLEDLQDQATNSPDWDTGTPIIRHDYFVEFVKKLAERNGIVHSKPVWPTKYIDWGKAALEWKQYYKPVTFAGVEYLVRK